MTPFTNVFCDEDKNYIGRTIISLQTISTHCFLHYCVKKIFANRTHALFFLLPFFFDIPDDRKQYSQPFFSTSKFFLSVFSQNKQWEMRRENQIEDILFKISILFLFISLHCILLKINKLFIIITFFSSHFSI